VPAGHRWAGRDAVGLAELVTEPLIALDPTLRPRQLLDEALEADGLAAAELVECGNAQVAQALAAAGRGVAIVSDDPRFGLRPLRVDTGRGPLRITLHAAWDPAHHAAPALAAIADRLRAFCRTRYGPAVTPP
jgi:DNA-binding transcriptional LysR family regulator